MELTNMDYCCVYPIFTFLHEVGNNLYRDEKRTESARSARTTLMLCRNNLYRDEKRTESIFIAKSMLSHEG